MVDTRERQHKNLFKQSRQGTELWAPVRTEKHRTGDIETMTYITSHFLSMLLFFHCTIPESQRCKILPDSVCDQILSKGAVGKLLKTVGRMWRVSHPDKKISKLKTKKAKQKKKNPSPCGVWLKTTQGVWWGDRDRAHVCHPDFWPAELTL